MKFSPKQSPVPRAPSEEVSVLCKRKAELAWAPGSGVPCYAFGAREEMEKNSKMLRTSLLFLELQASVKAAIQSKAKKEKREADLSREIAMRHPIRFPEQQPAQSHATIAHEEVQVAAKRRVVEEEAIMEPASKKFKPELPAPLTVDLLRAASAELSSGAVLSINTCVKCWQDKKMDSAEVISTVKSFASGSTTLKKAFAAAAPEPQQLGETASQEDLKALALLAGTA